MTSPNTPPQDPKPETIVSKEPRMGTAIWGALLVLFGVLLTVTGFAVPLDLTIVMAATLGGLGVLFIILSLRRRS